MKVLVLDIGGSPIKVMATEQEDVVECLRAALVVDEVLIGGGNVHRLKAMPEGARAGDNSDAFTGGLRLWESDGAKV